MQGSLLWFNDKELQDVVIVDPQWITKTFATVVSLKFGFIKVRYHRVALQSAVVVFFSAVTEP
jgi:hypothetical protein